MMMASAVTYFLTLLSAILATAEGQGYNISIIAGTGIGNFSGEGGQGTSAALNGPCAVVVDKTNSNLYISDCENNRVRKLSLSTGIITTFVGTGSYGSSGDGGDATSAMLNNPSGLALDRSNEYLYISDYGNHVIRRVQISTNNISLYAGTYEANGSTDGAATSATFLFVDQIAMDSSDNMYLADHGNHKIRKITYSTSIVSTFAGTGSKGSSGDEGPATSASLANPRGVAVIKANTHLYIADTDNNRICRVTLSSNIIYTIVGTGSAGFSGDGEVAIYAMLSSPQGLTLDGSGNLFIADFGNNRIRKTAVLTSNLITTFAGSGSATYSNEINVYATAANLNGPKGVVVDYSDNVYVAEYGGHRIRQVMVSSPTVTPTMRPSANPTLRPGTPTAAPSVKPSSLPTSQPSSLPTSQPSSLPTSSPLSLPTSLPTSQPLANPSSKPSSRPSTHPTSHPTKKDLKIANLFDTPITKEYVKAKVDFFLGSYVVFFAIIYMLLELLGRMFNRGRATIDKLTRSAVESGKFMMLLDERSTEEFLPLCKIRLFEKALRYHQSTAHSRVVNEQHREADGDVAKGAGVATQSPLNRSASFLKGLVAPKADKKKVYDDEFYSYILSRRCFFGCEATVFPDGIDLYFFKVKPGVVEDYLLYICNNHSVLSCIYGVKGSSYSRSSRSLVYSLQHMFVFALVALSNSILATARAPAIAAPLVNTLIVPTCSPLLNKMFQWLFIVGSKKYVDKRLTALLCLAGGMSLLVFAALSTSSDSRFGIITVYLLQVILSSFVRELILPILLYSSESYTGILLCSRPLLQVGLHNYEVFLRNQIGNDEVYETYSATVLCVTFERIYKRAVENLVTSSSNNSDIDGDLYSTYKDSVPMTTNPLLLQSGADRKGVELISVKVGSHTWSSDYELREAFSMENPMVALARSQSVRLSHIDTADVAITVDEQEEEEEEEEETESLGGDLRNLLRSVSLRLLPEQQVAPERGGVGLGSRKRIFKPRPGPNDDRSLRSSFTEKIEFFEKSAFLQRRASLRASIDPSALDVQQQLKAAAEEHERLRREETNRRLTAIANPNRSALFGKRNSQLSFKLRNSAQQEPAASAQI